MSLIRHDAHSQATQATHFDDADLLLERLARSPRDRAQVLQRLLGEQACRQLGLVPLPEGFKLSVVIPVYNERQWLRDLVGRVPLEVGARDLEERLAVKLGEVLLDSSS